MKKNRIIESFKTRMIETGKVIILPKDSPLREMLGLNKEDVEPTNAEEE